MQATYTRRLLIFLILIAGSTTLSAQGNLKSKFNNSSIFTGIEVGSKGVKMSVVELGKNAQSSGAFNVLKDTAINTDFISFTEPTFQATLDALYSLYIKATKEYRIPSKRVFTVISSGVKTQGEKDNKSSWVMNLVDSFRLRINDSERKVEVVDVMQEALLSHLGIVPESRRYTTFLIDIGSGNTKGGFFPYGNTKDFKLFQLNWGTKSTANATEKRLEEDKSMANFNKQLYRVLSGAENSEIIYAVNSSGSYPLSDNIAVSGGIAWAVSTLMHPEMLDNSIVPVAYADVAKFFDKLQSNYASLSDAVLVKNIKDDLTDKTAAAKEIKRVHQVFDQRSLLAGTGLLLRMMRQFESAYESKQFFLVKSGQVGWISAYVDQHVSR